MYIISSLYVIASKVSACLQVTTGFTLEQNVRLYMDKQKVLLFTLKIKQAFAFQTRLRTYYTSLKNIHKTLIIKQIHRK